jgi:2-hydroxycyclohexanecarboxyl-CoA dehydrogenase
MELSAKTALVSGAASGIGKATALTLAAAGARVIVTDIDTDGGEKTTEEIQKTGGNADFFALDVSDQLAINTFRDKVWADQLHIDIVVNVAGWGKVEPFIENTPEFWAKVTALNFTGPIALTRAFLEPMLEKRAGKIVTVASDAGRVGSLGETVYAGAKGGVIAFTKSLARETARFGINVNAVCPGPTDTPLLQRVPEKHREAFIRATPMRRLAKPAEIADAILFFASDRASFITGQVLSVSGGLTMAD